MKYTYDTANDLTRIQGVIYGYYVSMTASLEDE